MFARKNIFRILIIFYIFLFIALFLRGFLLRDATFRIGICLIPFVLIPVQSKERTLRFLPVVILFLIGGFFIEAKSFRYIFILVSFIFLIESLQGKISLLLLWLLLIISPIFRYLSDVFTFPIRLKLSEWTGFLLTSAGFPVKISGNIIQSNSSEFSVDPACMGLQMLGFSFLAGIFLIVHYQRITRKELPLFFVISIMIAAFGLNIFSNLMRILVLVIFEILPENPVHDLVGIFSLLLYAVLPISFLVKYLFRTHALAFQESCKNETKIRPVISIANVAILLFCVFFVFNKPNLSSKHKANYTGINGKYKVNEIENGITQYRSSQALIYAKPIPAFYSSEHSPYTCWKGSGYTFTSIREEMIAGNVIYFGTLQKGKDELQTAWWFSNDEHNTISQLDWRWRTLQGEPDFTLINVTATDKNNLKTAIQEWL